MEATSPKEPECPKHRGEAYTDFEKSIEVPKTINLKKFLEIRCVTINFYPQGDSEG